MKDDNANFAKKQPMRPHHIQEWAETRGLTRQVDLVEALGADPGQVSRWYAGASPGIEWQNKLAALFKIERESLFRHPDEVWVAEFLAGRPRPEVERIKTTLEAAFPRKLAKS